MTETQIPEKSGTIRIEYEKGKRILKKKQLQKKLAGWIVLFMGIGMFVLPDYENWKADNQEQARILSFQRENNPVDSLTDSAEKQKKDIVNGIEDLQIQENTNLVEIFQKDEILKYKIQQYNENLASGNQQEVFNAETIMKVPEFLTEYQDYMFGYLEIPKIDCRMSLYLGSSDAHMNMGAAVLGGTSLPMGGENTNCVIAGHRGWKQRSYFKRIEELEVGDEILVTNPWQCLHYRVSCTEIILPTDSDKLKIQSGKDMVTLLTCHPYRSGGKYRYVVYCLRTEEEQDLVEASSDAGDGHSVQRAETIQAEKENGKNVTSIRDIQREEVFRKAGKWIMIILLGVLCMVQIKHVFCRFTRRTGKCTDRRTGGCFEQQKKNKER